MEHGLNGKKSLDSQPQSLGWIINHMERGPQDINTSSGPYLGSVAVAVGIHDR